MVSLAPNLGTIAVGLAVVHTVKYQQRDQTTGPGKAPRQIGGWNQPLNAGEWQWPRGNFSQPQLPILTALVCFPAVP